MTMTLDMTRDLAPRLLMTVRIVGVRKWHARMWLATRFIKLMALIMNVQVKIEDKPWSGADL